MQRYTLEEAKQLAAQFSKRSNAAYYVVNMEDEFVVVSASEMKKLPGAHNRVVYSAAPEGTPEG